MRLIDADAPMESLTVDPIGCPGCPEPEWLEELSDILDTAPTIEAVELVRGEWIKHKERTETNGKFIDFFPAEYECSNCGLREAHYFINSKPHNYCPNCGAKMEE